MKFVTIFATILVLGGGIAHSARFETLRVDGVSTKTFSTSTTDLVTITGIVLSNGEAAITFTIPAEDDLVLPITTNEARSGTFIGQSFTGLNAIAAAGSSAAASFLVTFKIQTAEEVATVSPPNVLLLPEGLTGEYDLIIEESTDLVAWTPLATQGITADAARRFYRTRIVQRSDP